MSDEDLTEEREIAKQNALFDAAHLQAVLDHWHAGIRLVQDVEILSDPDIIALIRDNISGNWGSTIDLVAICTTSVFSAGKVNAYYGDFEANPWHWGPLPNPCPTGDVIRMPVVYDIYSTLAHEFGHALDLHHFLGMSFSLYSAIVDQFGLNNIMDNTATLSHRNRLTVAQLFRSNWSDESSVCRLSSRTGCIQCSPVSCPRESVDLSR
jgi:hypothetical protein